MTEIRAARLLPLRPWREADLAPFAALNADPEVRHFFPGMLSRERSDALAAEIRAHIAARGFSFWAVEVPRVAPFVGFVGLQHVSSAAPFAPAVEVGWQLARAHWGGAMPRRRPAPRSPAPSGCWVSSKS